MVKLQIVSQCRHSCPMFCSTPQEMWCGHPALDNTGYMGNMIITRDNSVGRVPDKCPLRTEQLQTVVKLSAEAMCNPPQ